MKISSKSSATVRFLSFLSVVAVVIVAARAVFEQVMRFLIGEGPLGMAVPFVVVLILAILAVAWTVIGHHHEWHIGDRHIRIRQRTLTRWKRDVLIHPHDIDSIEREEHVTGGDRDNGLPCYSLVVRLKDGRVFESPRMFDDAQVSRAWRKVEALLEMGR